MTINFEAKTDRELLMLVAQQGEQCVEQGREHTGQLRALNGKLQKHESRLVLLEARESWRPRSKRGWFTGGAALLAIVTLAATFAGKLLEQLHWWP